MLLVRQPQLRFLVFHKCRQPDLPKPVSKVFEHKVEASLLISQDLQNSLNRIFGGLNTVLAPPRRGHPIFYILNEIRWESGLTAGLTIRRPQQDRRVVCTVNSFSTQAQGGAVTRLSCS